MKSSKSGAWGARAVGSPLSAALAAPWTWLVKRESGGGDGVRGGDGGGEAGVPPGGGATNGTGWSKQTLAMPPLAVAWSPCEAIGVSDMARARSGGEWPGGCAAHHAEMAPIGCAAHHAETAPTASGAASTAAAPTNSFSW